MPTDPHPQLDCRATAAILRAGRSLAAASHTAALLAILPILKTGTPAWIAFVSLLVWCAAIYLSIRVAIDEKLFTLLAEHSPEALDEWLDAARLGKQPQPRSIADRRRGALKLWRALALAVSAQLALIVVSILSLLA